QFGLRVDQAPSAPTLFNNNVLTSTQAVWTVWFACSSVSGSVAISTGHTWGVQVTTPAVVPTPTDNPCTIKNPTFWGAVVDVNGNVSQFSRKPLRDPASYYGGYKAPRLLQMGMIN